jgi:hypothetical protein
MAIVYQAPTLDEAHPRVALAQGEALWFITRASRNATATVCFTAVVTHAHVH